MKEPLLVKKYKYQLQAAMPNYDVACPYNGEKPITFDNPEDIKLSFAVIADTHIVNNEAAFSNLQNIFKDMENTNGKFDALLLAGDITEYSRKKEFAGFFKAYDKCPVKNVLLTLGNHDARFFFEASRKTVMAWEEKRLGINIGKKSYYSYDINGYTFIVLCTEKRVLEKAHITETQIAFLDSELKRATAEGKPAFVMCHQAFQNTHGLPEVWKTGDMGKQSDEVRAVMEKYKNVFFVNGHLHSGVCDMVEEVLNKENNVISLTIPSYRKTNNFGNQETGIGYYCCVYDGKVEFTARNFLKGEEVTGDYTKFSYELI